MHADLVRAAGFDLDIEQSEFLETLPYLPQAESLAAVGGDRHLGAVPAVAGDRAVDRAGVVTRAAVDECNVGFEDLAVAELVGEGFVGLFVLSDDDEAGGVFVETMDDADAVRAPALVGSCSRSRTTPSAEAAATPPS